MASPATYRLFELLPMMPRFTVERVRQRLKTTFPTANGVKVLEQLGAAVEGEPRLQLPSLRRSADAAPILTQIISSYKRPALHWMVESNLSPRSPR